MRWTIDTIIEATGGRLIRGPGDRGFSGVSIDSRTIGPQDLFVAIRGENHDGHAFIKQVVAQGCLGCVVRADQVASLELERVGVQDIVFVSVADTNAALGALAAYQRRRYAIPVVAVTGSNGKTTTRTMTALVMSQRYDTLSSQGNFNNEIGLPLTLLRLNPHHQAAVLELGMNHFGEMDRLGAVCTPTIGVITNVAAAHLEFLGSIEGVARAKGELIPHIDPRGVVVLNADDPHVAALAGGAKCRVLFFGAAEGAHVRAVNIRAGCGGIAFDLVLPGERIDIQLKTPGRFMVFNALAAAAVGHLAGLGGQEIQRALEAFAPVNGRLNVLRTPAGVNLIDDTYNANPSSTQAAIETLTGLRSDAPSFLVLGDMLELGDFAETLHRQVGRLAALARPRRLYVHGPLSGWIARAAVEAGMAPAMIVTGDKDEIADDLLKHLSAGCWVLVKGSRGMAMETIVEAVRAWKGPRQESAIR